MTSLVEAVIGSGMLIMVQDLETLEVKKLGILECFVVGQMSKENLVKNGKCQEGEMFFLLTLSEILKLNRVAEVELLKIFYGRK
jgi:hypothetical protein